MVRRRLAPTRIGALIGVAVAGGTLCWWLGRPSLGPASPGEAVAAGAQLAGLVASVLVCVQVLLIARLPWLARALGLPGMVRWHRRVGPALLILIVVHVVLAMVAGMLLERRTPWSELAVAVFGDPELVQAMLGTALIVAAGLTSARIARSRLRYEWWHAIHVTVYLGVFLSFAHQVNSGVHFLGAAELRVAWTAMYLLTAVLVLAGRAIVPVVGLLRHQTRVDRVVRESSNVTSVWLTGVRLHRLRVRPGQFFFVRFLAPGQRWTTHPYSVSLLPAQGRIRFTIGAVGDHSARIRFLAPGTRVMLEGPFGSFCAPRSTCRGALLIAGGSGVAPIAALARELCRRGRDVVVLQRSSGGAPPLREELAALDLRLVPVVGSRRDLGQDPLAPDHLRELVPDVAAREAYVCGSAGLVRSVTDALVALGVPTHRIHREDLGLV
jgi:predicted ferric reductase